MFNTFSINAAKHGVPSTLIELGAGLGLPSIVASRLGVKHIITTDLPIALPMLNYNIQKNTTNNNNDAVNGSKSPPPMSPLKLLCPLGHSMTDTITDSDEYMCSVCENDIDEEAGISRCTRCNFDVCHQSCLAKIETNQLSDLPMWFRVQLEYQIAALHNNALNSIDLSTDSTLFHLRSCDWSQEDDRKNILQKFLSFEAVSSCYSSVCIIGADITYNMNSVAKLFSFLNFLIAELLQTGSSAESTITTGGGSSGSSTRVVRLMLVHQVRSYDTSQLFLNELHFRNQSKWSIRCTRSLLDISQDAISTNTTRQNIDSDISSSSTHSGTMDSAAVELIRVNGEYHQNGSGEVYKGFQSLIDDGVYLFDMHVQLCL